MDVDCKYCGAFNSHLTSCPTQLGSDAVAKWEEGYKRGRENLESEKNDNMYRRGWQAGKDFFEQESHDKDEERGEDIAGDGAFDTEDISQDDDKSDARHGADDFQDSLEAEEVQSDEEIEIERGRGKCRDDERGKLEKRSEGLVMEQPGDEWRAKEKYDGDSAHEERL